jgi:hypothetical protein
MLEILKHFMLQVMQTNSLIQNVLVLWPDPICVQIDALPGGLSEASLASYFI